VTDPQFSVERLDHQPIVSIRGVVSHSDAPAFFDRSFSTLFADVAERRGRIVGPAFSCTHAKTEDGMDVEVALPLETPIPDSGEIVASEGPPIEVATTHHVGSYSKLPETCQALVEFAQGNGREVLGTGYEFYIDDPSEVAVESHRTRIALPLRE